MVRLIILVLIIIGGIWMFRACENDGEKVEFTTKEQKNERAEKPDSRESKDSQEEKSSNTEDKEDGEATTLIGKEEGSDTENEKDVDGEAEKKDLENSTEVDTNSGDAKTTGDDEKNTDTQSWSGKLMDKLKGADSTTGTKADTTASNTNKTSVNGSTNPGNEGSYGIVGTGNPSRIDQVKKQPVVPNRDSYLKVFVYENNIDTFGKPPTTGRIHFWITNSGEWTQNIHIPGIGDLGKIRGGERKEVVLDAATAGNYFLKSYSAMGGAERSLPVVE